jgi:S1-C subfamily serine protease
MAWLGIGYDTDENGHWVVDKVYDRSPAEKAGFQKGDVLLAVNDVKYSKDNKTELKAVFATFEPGAKATYWVKRDGEKVKLEATLGSVPKDVQEQWIAEHMEHSHPEFQMASK